MNFSGKKVFVTGAGGFIGSHLCEALLNAGAEVTAMVRYSSRSDWGNLEFLPADMKDSLRVVFGSIEDAEFLYHHFPGHQVVIHLAALIGIPYSYVSPRGYLRTNVEGTLNVLEACRRVGVERLVHTSTSEVYGTALYTPIDEAHPLQGQSPYSATKIAADKLAESYHLSFKLPVVVVRPFNTFGPRQSARAVIPTIICQALAKEHVSLGALDPIRDLTFVRDTVEGFLLAALTPGVEGEVINLGVGQGISIGELAAAILRTMSVDKPIIQDPRRIRPEKSEVMALISNNGKAAGLLNWQPRYRLGDALNLTIDFVRSHPQLFRPDHYAV